jgi:DNA-binding CsgD family transcriptional regulator
VDNNKSELESKQSDPAIETPITRRTRKTKVMLEHELNEIYRLLVEGVSPQEIKATRSISDRNFSKYMQKLRDRLAGDQKSKLQEYYQLDLQIANGRFLADKRNLREIIANPETPVKAKLVAIKLDMDINTALLKLKYEGTTPSDALSSLQRAIDF